MRFVLVHGGSVGAWCWDRLVPELERLGHQALAVDLPGHGARRSEASTLDGYRRTVLEVLKDGDVLVGHSMGGVPATLAANAFPAVGHIVFLAGVLPAEGQTLFEAMGGQTGEASERFMPQAPSRAEDYLHLNDDGITFSFELDKARQCFFHDCPPELVAWAHERMTPQRFDFFLTEKLSAPSFWTAELPRSYIVCTEDRALPPEVSSRFAARLGVEPLTIGTSHFPQLSRPADLAWLLVRAVGTRSVGPLCSR